MKNTYYKDQLDKIHIVKIEGYKEPFYPNVKFFDTDGNRTKYINVNLESIPVIIEWLKDIQKTLKEV